MTMADFTAVSVALDSDGSSVVLSGQATTTEAHDVTVTSVVRAVVDGSTRSYDLAGTETATVPGVTVLDSVTDTAGRVYTISADGQRATL